MNARKAARAKPDPEHHQPAALFEQRL